MTHLTRWLLVSAAVSAAALLATASSARAHETGVLRPAAREFPAGGTVRVLGEKFTKRAALTLFLVGTRGRIELTQVQTDSTGAFATDLTVPADAAPGDYRLIAVAADGDRVGSVDVTVAAAAETEAAAQHTGHDMEEPAAPSAEPLALERAGNTPVTVSAVAVVLLGALVGGALLRRRGDVV